MLNVPSASAATDDWKTLKHGSEERRYMKLRMYDMAWKLEADLQEHGCAAAPCGGPVALLQGSGAAMGVQMHIFNAAGHTLSRWPWEYGRVLALGWSSSQELVCVLETGRVVLWSVTGERIAEFAIGAEVEAEGVLQCRVCADSLVVLTHSLRLYALLSWTERHLVALADPRLSSPPFAMAVLEPPAGSVDPPRVLLAIASRTVLAVDEDAVHDQQITSGPFSWLVPSPSRKFIAAFSQSGSLLVLSADFSRTLSEFITRQRVPPKNLVWCADDALLLQWERQLVMVGPYGDCIQYSYESAPLMFAEDDCVRIVGMGCTELLRRVPAALEATLGPHSDASAAKLLQASDAFSAHSSLCHELLLPLLPRRSGNECTADAAASARDAHEDSSVLRNAVRTCIEAATHSLHPPTQQRLLRAASYGKNYLDELSTSAKSLMTAAAAEAATGSGQASHPAHKEEDEEVTRRRGDASLFVNACRELRALNAVRAPAVGLLITWAQYTRLDRRQSVGSGLPASPASALATMLLAQHEHLLTLRLAELFKLGKLAAFTVRHWAQAKIRAATASLSDDALFTAIVPKMRGCRTASYAEVAAEAIAVGRRGLATRLLERETQPAKQVPLLLQMGEDQRALHSAVAHGDGELVYLVLLQLKQRLEQSHLFELLKPHPWAEQLLVLYCQKREPEMLKSFYYHANRPSDAAALALHEGYRATRWEQRMRALSIALQFYEHHLAAGGMGTWGDNARSQYSQQLARATREQLRLLELQKQLEQSTKNAKRPPGSPTGSSGGAAGNNCDSNERFLFVDQPLNETVCRCFWYGHDATAEQLLVEFKIPERRWLRLKLKGLARAHRWEALWQMSQAKRLPVPLETFAEACANQGALVEANRYAQRLTAAEAVPLLLRIGQIDEARQHSGGQPDLLRQVDTHVVSG